MSYRTVHVIIKGRVQAVGYRNWTLTKAQTLGINGWVRNVQDGSVEAVFSAEAAAVSAMLEACKKGPRQAEVSAVEVEPVTVTVPQGFTIKSF